MPERRINPSREKLAESRTLPYRRRRAESDKTLPSHQRMAESKESTEQLRPAERARPTERLTPAERKGRSLEETHRFTHPKRKKRSVVPGEPNLLVDLLTLPILGAPRMVSWIGKKTVETVEQSEFDEGAVQGQLLELQMRYELGELTEEEYTEQETALLERIKVIREAKEEKDELEGRIRRPGNP